MFKELKPVLEDASLSMTISSKGDSISVTVTPKGKGGAALNNAPLAISGTAEELDELFVGQIVKSMNETAGFRSTAADFKKSAEKQVESAKKENTVKEEKNSKVTEKTKETTEKTEKAPVVELNKDQKAAESKFKKSLADAAKATDPDIVAFHKKTIVGIYSKAGFDEAAINLVKKAFDDLPNAPKAEVVQSDVFKEEEKKVDEAPAPPEEENEEDNQPEEVNKSAAEEENADGGESQEDEDDIF